MSTSYTLPSQPAKEHEVFEQIFDELEQAHASSSKQQQEQQDQGNLSPRARILNKKAGDEGKDATETDTERSRAINRTNAQQSENNIVPFGSLLEAMINNGGGGSGGGGAWSSSSSMTSTTTTVGEDGLPISTTTTRSTKRMEATFFLWGKVERKLMGCSPLSPFTEDGAPPAVCSR